jgi:hypothetical protein
MGSMGEGEQGSMDAGVMSTAQEERAKGRSLHFPDFSLDMATPDEGPFHRFGTSGCRILPIVSCRREAREVRFTHLREKEARHERIP